MYAVYDVMYMGAVNNMMLCIGAVNNSNRRGMCAVYDVMYMGTVNNSNRHGMCAVYNVMYMGAVNNSNRRGMCAVYMGTTIATSQKNSYLCVGR